MGGLMMALAGGLKGLGDGMIDKAKADREAAIVALARTHQVEDRDVNIAATKANLDTSEAGATQREQMGNDTSVKTTGMNNATSLADTASNNATSIKTTGMNNATSRADTATTEEGANTRNRATLDAAANSVDRLLPPSGNGQQIALTKSGKTIPLKDGSGAPITGDVTLTAPESRLLKVYQAKNVLRDEDGSAIVDPGGRLQYDDAKIDAQLRAAGQSRLADKISGTAPPSTSTPFLNTDANNATDTGIGAAAIPGQTGGGLTTNLFGGGNNLTPPANPSTGGNQSPAVDFSKATASATNPKTGQKILQVGGQWYDMTGKPVQ